MIQLQNVSLSFGSQTIFDNISYIIDNSAKIGLVGLNGSGKSTLLKAIAHQTELDDGRITISSNKKIGYMPQEVVLVSTKSAVDEIMSSIEIFDETEVEALRAESKKILMGLGFTIQQMEQPVNSLSVGWRMRVVLATLLMQKADFYLFDEPTNHLDIVTKQWFLNFLKNAPFGFLIVCHERYFLDQLCDTIFELEKGKGTAYKGNYTSYLDQKEKRKEALVAAYHQQQKEIARKQATIERFRASTKASMAKSMEKALSKVEIIELPDELKKVNFKLPEVVPSGRLVITVTNLRHSFDTKKVFSDVCFDIENKEKVSIIAANGVGKTTLLNIIMNKLALQNGHIKFGYNVLPAFFEQDQVSALNPEKTIFETIQEAVPHVTDLAIRNMLGSFLFTKDFIHKKTKVLSGGERNRLSMAKVLLQKANFLILDEPTNHLDIPSKEILIDALGQYNGTILFVSHDQDFINKIATHVIELTSNGCHKYSGNYDDYLNHKSTLEQQSETKINSPTKKESSKNINNYEKNKEIRKLENQIEKIEKEISKLSEELASYEYGSNEFSQRYNRIAEIQAKHKGLLKEWEDLAQ